MNRGLLYLAIANFLNIGHDLEDYFLDEMEQNPSYFMLDSFSSLVKSVVYNFTDMELAVLFDVMNFDSIMYFNRINIAIQVL